MKNIFLAICLGAGALAQIVDLREATVVVRAGANAPGDAYLLIEGYSQ